MWTPIPSWLGLLLATVAFVAVPVRAQTPTEAAELKAQVLLRVLLFVQWPPDRLGPRQAVELCLLQEDGLGASLLRQQGQALGGRRLNVRRIAAAVPDPGCHAVYASTDLPPLPAGHGMLVVADRFGMIERGAMVNLHMEGGRPGFDVGLGALRRARLDMSAKLLRLARYVKDE